MRWISLLPHLAGLRVRHATLSAATLELDLEPLAATARCPSCHRRSRHVHSRYVRHITDQPIGGRRVLFHLHVRRFRCRTATCPRRTFAEQVPRLAARYARRSVPLQAFLADLGSIPGGPTRVQMKNTGKEIHHAQFMLLNPGVTPDQLGAAFAKGEQGLGEVFGLVTQTGGVGVILPGSSAEVILDLKEGQYMIACFIAGDDHIPHLAKGMLMPLKVTAAPATTAATPAVNGTITMFDFNFTMPDTLPAGRSMYTVTNTGAQFHEFNIGQLAPGKTLADAKAFLDPAPNYPPACGTAARCAGWRHERAQQGEFRHRCPGPQAGRVRRHLQRPGSIQAEWRFACPSRHDQSLHRQVAPRRSRKKGRSIGCCAPSSCPAHDLVTQACHAPLIPPHEALGGQRHPLPALPREAGNPADPLQRGQCPPGLFLRHAERRTDRPGIDQVHPPSVENAEAVEEREATPQGTIEFPVRDCHCAAPFRWSLPARYPIRCQRDARTCALISPLVNREVEPSRWRKRRMAWCRTNRS